MNEKLKAALIHKIDTKTKPIGALGMLEEIALQIGLIQSSTTPQIINPHIIVFAGDHGIAATNLVNPFPQAVTAQMVLNFVAGGAAINTFTKNAGINLTVVDAGVNADFDKALPIVHAKINKGTANYLEMAAMTEAECLQAIASGKKIVEENILAKNNTVKPGTCNCIGFGEMGIGNTSAASLIMSSILHLDIEDCVGRGTGSDDKQLQQKKDCLKKVYAFHNLALLHSNPIALLSAVGGFEIAMMAGAYIQAAEKNMVIVVDGFIATSALLIALQLAPGIINHCIFSHQSNEMAHGKILSYLKVKPLLNLGLRLGEGTGAALAIPLIQQSVNFLNEMASFESAGVSENN